MNWRETIRRYHEATSHTPERLRARPHTLDWAQMPNPFRHYEGAPLLDLPGEPPAPRVRLLPLLMGETPVTLAADAPDLLSALLLHAAAVSATKIAPSGARYALRVNPSSGNLHPTEFHFAANGLDGWPDGVYHYRPSQHMAEQRATGRAFSEPLVFLLSTIAWREAWKYRERAYRYCLLDAGHAVEALVVAARALGWEHEVRTELDEIEMAERFHLAPDEWPLVLVSFEAPGFAARPVSTLDWTPGAPNRLSDEVARYPEIEDVHDASGREARQRPVPDRMEGPVALPAAAESGAMFAPMVRGRRSALDFVGGDRTISMATLAALLDAAASGNEYVQLWMYAHRVDGLAMGVYRVHQETRSLECVREGDQRVMAAALSLAQDLAGNACVAFSMTGEARLGYRDLHLEAGRLGHRLYLAAESMGLRATGIGAFYDEAVLGYLGLDSPEAMVLYHFALGHPVRDPRLAEE